MNINGGHHKKLHKAHKSPLISALSFVLSRRDLNFSETQKKKNRLNPIYQKLSKSNGRLRANFLKRRKRPEAILIQLSERQKRQIV